MQARPVLRPARQECGDLTSGEASGALLGRQSPHQVTGQEPEAVDIMAGEGVSMVATATTSFTLQAFLNTVCADKKNAVNWNKSF